MPWVTNLRPWHQSHHQPESVTTLHFLSRLVWNNPKKHFTKKPQRDDNQKFSYQFLNIGIQLVFQVARQMIIRVNAARPWTCGRKSLQKCGLYNRSRSEAPPLDSESCTPFLDCRSALSRDLKTSAFWGLQRISTQGQFGKRRRRQISWSD